MNPRGRGDHSNSVSRTTISRRKLLAVSGAVAVGGLSGCLSRVASVVTNTTAAPAAVFAGNWPDDDTMVSPLVARDDSHVSRLTPTLSGESRGLSGEVELEGWVTSSAVVAANYNNTRSNRSSISSPDSAVTDEELERILRYLEGEVVVAERFTVCLPDAEVPGGNGSIREAVTPQRLLDYVTGQSDGGGRVYSWGDADADGDGLGDCDDSEGSGEPGTVCGATEHLVADVRGPTATGGSLEMLRASDGSVLVVNSPPEADGGPSTTCASMAVKRDDDPCGPGVWARASGGGNKASPYVADTFVVAQVMVQPPECPHPFPGLLYVTYGESDGQLVYTGGWVIDDAALYEDSVTVLSMADVPRVVGVDIGDLDDDGLSDGLERSLSGVQGSQIVGGSVGVLIEAGVMSAGAGESVDHWVRKKPGGRSSDGGGGGGRIAVTHVALDAPVLHLTNAGGASESVKFKAGAELSKSVN